MAIFKIEPHEQYTLKGMLNYISDATIHDNQILFTDVLYAINTNPLYDMMLTKLLNCKTVGVQYKQITLSLNEEESDRQTDFIAYAKKLHACFAIIHTARLPTLYMVTLIISIHILF